ncbi:MAG: BamA/TamA family outer membrane protein, partial [Acidobacteriota bacterium]|nr:BamA/TamA family outer membrane protein [Acidobacteriota bacterium]
AFGLRLAHASIEYRHPLWLPAMARVGLAVFADAARALHRLDGSSSRLHVDAGVGVRLALPGKGGAMRLDVARGMHDQQVVVSAGWQPSWTGQHHE